MSSEHVKRETFKYEPVKHERRAMARYRDNIPVTVKIDDSILEANAIEISFAGMRVECKGAIASHVFSRYIRVMPGENIAATLDISILNQKGLLEVLHSKATLVSVNRAAQSLYIVGFKFLEFHEVGLEKWKQYISTKFLV